MNESNKEMSAPGKAQGADRYADIIGLPHHVSAKRNPMSMGARAAQFSPFAALEGFDEVIDSKTPSHG